jgi:hypothetical protein
MIRPVQRPIASISIVAFSPTKCFTSESIGAIILQGPHHSAEKSTNTGFSPFINSENRSDAMCYSLEFLQISKEFFMYSVMLVT